MVELSKTSIEKLAAMVRLRIPSLTFYGSINNAENIVETFVKRMEKEGVKVNKNNQRKIRLKAYKQAKGGVNKFWLRGYFHNILVKNKKDYELPWEKKHDF